MVRWNKAYKKGTQEIVEIDEEFCKETEFECMACGEIMIARKGGSRKHHFAHKQTTNKCNPESYFHRLSKKLFKEIYEQSTTYWILNSFCKMDLKDEYKQCLIECKKGVYIADLLLKHANDEKKDILVEIFYSHQISIDKLNEGYPIIEIQIPRFKKDIDSDEIEENLKVLFTPPLREREEIRFYNFNKKTSYNNPTSKAKTNSKRNNDVTDCSFSNISINNESKFKKYNFQSNKVQTNDTPKEYNNLRNLFKYSNIEIRSSTPKTEKQSKTDISKHILFSRNESIKNEIIYDVTAEIKRKYPEIRHQPAVLPNFRHILDVIIKDENEEYWLGINYNKTEVFHGDLESKIPDKWKKAVKEYIDGLKIKFEE